MSCIEGSVVDFVRDHKSCKNHWHTINTLVSKFVDAYNHAKKRKASGHSESDVIMEAHHIHESDTGRDLGLSMHGTC